MSECYCNKHQTANHTDDSEYCKVWEIATAQQRADIYRAVAKLRIAADGKCDPGKPDWKYHDGRVDAYDDVLDLLAEGDER